MPIKAQLREMYLPTVTHHTAAEVKATLSLTIEKLKQAIAGADSVKDTDDLDLYFQSAQEFVTIADNMLEGIQLASRK